VDEVHGQWRIVPGAQISTFLGEYGEALPHSSPYSAYSGPTRVRARPVDFVDIMSPGQA
jgi:hypothetical protein